MQYLPLKSFDTDITANIWLSKLKDQGINCYLEGEFTVTIDPGGGVKLYVAGNQLEQAKELIAQFEENSKQAQKCPHCGSLDVQYVPQYCKSTNWVSSIASWLFSSSVKQVYHCYHCGYEFDEIEAIDTETNKL